MPGARGRPTAGCRCPASVLQPAKWESVTHDVLCTHPDSRQLLPTKLWAQQLELACQPFLPMPPSQHCLLTYQPMSLSMLRAPRSVFQTPQPIVLCPMKLAAPWNPTECPEAVLPSHITGVSPGSELGCQQMSRTAAVLPQQALRSSFTLTLLTYLGHEAAVPTTLLYRWGS